MSPPRSRLAAFASSPRAAVVLAAVIVVVAVVVILLGSRSEVSDVGRSDAVTVTGAPTVTASPSVGPGGGDASSAPPQSAGPVVVHVVGAVARPGVVTLGAGSRVATAIERAGGATDGADLARINLARAVVDGERLYVPSVGETDIPAALDEGPAGTAGTPGDPSGAGSTGGGAASAGVGGTAGGAGAAGAGDAVVDLNTADQATLETLPGIGPSLAGRILAWRDAHGRFSTIEDLLDVSGIGDGRFADLRDRVRV